MDPNNVLSVLIKWLRDKGYEDDIFASHFNRVTETRRLGKHMVVVFSSPNCRLALTNDRRVVDKSGFVGPADKIYTL